MKVSDIWVGLGGGGEKGNQSFFAILCRKSNTHNKELCTFKQKHAIYIKLTSYKEKEIEIVNYEYTKQLFLVNYY